MHTMIAVKSRTKLKTVSKIPIRKKKSQEVSRWSQKKKKNYYHIFTKCKPQEESAFTRSWVCSCSKSLEFLVLGSDFICIGLEITLFNIRDETSKISVDSYPSLYLGQFASEKF